jgi:hypothetical protein
MLILVRISFIPVIFLSSLVTHIFWIFYDCYNFIKTGDYY